MTCSQCVSAHDTLMAAQLRFHCAGKERVISLPTLPQWAARLNRCARHGPISCSAGAPARKEGAASRRVPRGARAPRSASRGRLQTTNRARGEWERSRVLVVVCVRCPGGPRKLCKGTAASPGDDAQLEGSRPLHLPWPSPAQVPPSHVS